MRKFELQEAHGDLTVFFAVVRERADEQVRAGRGGRPLGGGPLVGERGRAAVVPGAVAVGGDPRPRAEARIARIYLDVLGEAFRAPVRVTELTVGSWLG